MRTPDPVLVRIDGRADFHNSACLRDFVLEMLRLGKKKFVIDFLHCTSMDSTFQGVLAEAALELRKGGPGGNLVLIRLGPRNLELVRNMGLHRLMTVDAGEFPMNFDRCETPLVCPDRTGIGERSAWCWRRMKIWWRPMRKTGSSFRTCSSFCGIA